MRDDGVAVAVGCGVGVAVDCRADVTVRRGAASWSGPTSESPWDVASASLSAREERDGGGGAGFRRRSWPQDAARTCRAEQNVRPREPQVALAATRAQHCGPAR